MLTNFQKWHFQIIQKRILKTISETSRNIPTFWKRLFLIESGIKNFSFGKIFKISCFRKWIFKLSKTCGQIDDLLWKSSVF